MLEYPITLTPDDNDTVMATSPDFPELTTYGDTEAEALGRAIDALDEAIAGRIADREEIPAPGRGRTKVRLRTLTTAKVLLYQAMREQGVGKAELARRCGWHLQQVDRVLDVSHGSKLDMIDTAFRAVGKSLHVDARQVE